MERPQTFSGVSIDNSQEEGNTAYNSQLTSELNIRSCIQGEKILFSVCPIVVLMESEMIEVNFDSN